MNSTKDMHANINIGDTVGHPSRQGTYEVIAIYDFYGTKTARIVNHPSKLCFNLRVQDLRAARP